MEWTGLNELREKYLSFFESKGHLRLPSFSLVPQGDKSLLLINAGMAPLKKYFTGELTPPRTRVTTCQKCIKRPILSASESPRATALSLRCSAISRSAITLSMRRPPGRGSSARRCSRCPRIRYISASIRTMTRRMTSGQRSSVFRPTTWFASAKRITSGSTAQAPAVPARSSILTVARSTAAVLRPAESAATATGMLSSGTSFSPSLITTATITIPAQELQYRYRYGS